MHVELLRTRMQHGTSAAWPCKALIVTQTRIGNTVRGLKVLERRTRATTVRGTIALVEQGSGHIVARARIAVSLPLGDAPLEASDGPAARVMSYSSRARGR